MPDAIMKDKELIARAREAMRQLVDDVVEKKLADKSLDALGKAILQIILTGRAEMELPTRLFYSLRVDGKPINELGLGHGIYVMRVQDSGTLNKHLGSTIEVSNRDWAAVLRDPDGFDGQEKARISLVDNYTASSK